MHQKKFASVGDIEEKKVTFKQLAEGVYAYTAEGDPNTGVIIGDDGVMVIDTQATPVMAQGVLAAIRSVTDKPVTHVVLSHYHAVRVLGASAYGAPAVIASQGTHDLIVERGQQDYASEVGRFPRLFQAVESVPGLTWPNIVFQDRLTVHLGSRRVEILHPGRGHSKGDTVVWLPEEKVLFAGDLVEYSATPYTGDAYLTDWPATLDKLRALKPAKLVPGRGEALDSPELCARAIDETQDFIASMFGSVKDSVAKGLDLKAAFQTCRAALQPRFGHWVIFEHCLPFDVSRAYDEASGVKDPRIWTAERDQAMWHALQE